LPQLSREELKQQLDRLAQCISTAADAQTPRVRGSVVYILAEDSAVAVSDKQLEYIEMQELVLNELSSRLPGAT
jgi:hypothetical protein